MNRKRIIFFIISMILICGVFFVIIRKKSGNNGNEVTHQKFDSLPIEEEIVDEDSLIHKLICSDYNVGWQYFDSKKNRYKTLFFDSASYKLLVYHSESDDLKSIKELNNNKVFVWNLEENDSEIFIKGEFGYTDKDTLMNWRLDKKTNALIDDSGKTFKKITFNNE